MKLCDKKQYQYYQELLPKVTVYYKLQIFIAHDPLTCKT